MNCDGMKVLIIGSGGREHALCWKISQSKHVDNLYCAPGNAGTGELAQNVDIKSEDLDGLLEFAQKEGIDLTVVGPDAPIAQGIVDLFKSHGLRIFGPSGSAARLESSKAFAKRFMASARIPTARYMVINSIEEAEKAANEFQMAAVKADGLAAGKGVIICNTPGEISEAVKTLKQPGLFGDAGKTIVIEELLKGDEASMLAFCDGKVAKLMLPSQDHKRIFDGDKGKNTGGMGAYAPTPIAHGLEDRIHAQVFAPALEEMSKAGTPYIGVLYAGLMISGGDFKVLEFNSRFGDPEAQPVLSLLDSDLVEIMQACIDGRLGEIDVKWKQGAACCVIMSSKGYPDKYEKGKVITGVEEANRMGGAIVFHAGTSLSEGRLVTSGGRVLGVTGVGASIAEAIRKAYFGVSCISFEGMHYRKDIGKAALARV